MNIVDSFLKQCKRYLEENSSQKKEQVKFYNWIGESNGYWFRKFIDQNEILRDSKKSIAFFSLFGEKLSIYLNHSNVKIFFTGENIHRNEFGHDFTRYENYGFDCGIDLALGFDYKYNNPNYLRFPLWILYEIPSTADAGDIKSICNNLSYHSLKESLRFCSLVSQHDPNGLRKEIYDALSGLGEISCGGSFLNNTDELKTTCKDDKILYLKQFKFNICPENTNMEGYVTEKIFQAMRSGSIPIYWGSNNDPEPDVINKNAVIFWNKGGDNTNTIRLIEELIVSPKLYKEFYEQPRLSPHADQAMIEIMHSLEQKLNFLIKNV